jgi:superfamily II DNA/RNA helicase
MTNFLTCCRLQQLIRNSFYSGNLRRVVIDEADQIFQAAYRAAAMAELGKLAGLGIQVCMYSGSVAPNQEETLRVSMNLTQLTVLRSDTYRANLFYRFVKADTTSHYNELIQEAIERLRLTGNGIVMRREPIDRALIFTRTKRGADKVVRGLIKAGISAHAIHGNKSQSQRERVLAAFRRGDVTTLVATDIAARGIDVDGISHVVNFDLPDVPETYVHRIGRTARAGAAGIAISLCDPEDWASLRGIEKLIGKSISGSDSRARSNRNSASNTHGRAGQQDPRSADKRRRRGENNVARTPRRHEQNGESTDGIASVAFLRRSTRPPHEVAPRAPRRSAQPKGSRHGQGRTPAI